MFNSNSSSFFIVALLMSPAALAQTSAVENLNTRLKISSEFKQASDLLLTEILACVESDKPEDKLAKLTKDMANVNAIKVGYDKHYTTIKSRISEILKEKKEVANLLVKAQSQIPTETPFKAISEKLQTAVVPAEITNPVARNITSYTSKTVDDLNRNVQISFTDSKGQRRLANAQKPDAEQRAVLEAVALSWINAPMQLVAFKHSKDGFNAKNKNRVKKVGADSINDVDGQALASSANLLIPKASILVESVNGNMKLNELGRKTQDISSKLGKALDGTGVSTLDIQTELTYLAEDSQPSLVDIQNLVLRQEALQSEYDRQYKDSVAFVDRIKSSNVTLVRLKLEFEKCKSKIQSSIVKSPVKMETKDTINEDAAAYEQMKAKEINHAQ